MNGKLPASTQISSVTLAVSDKERALRFYRDLAGLAVLRRDGDRVSLGAGDVAFIHLVEERGAQQPPRHTTGLYHTAVLYPDRAALASVIRHIATSGYPFTGASDHLVSEAFYLDDPDGHGVELYRDRPRDEWKWEGNSIQMASLPLDIDDLLSEARNAPDAREAPPGTRVGHVHLKTHDLAEAEAFYRDVIGFDVTAHFGDSATFLAAGGYHHHVAANTWESRGRGRAPEGSVGLREIVIAAPGRSGEYHDPMGHRVVISSSSSGDQRISS
jgi:catechol 2,3-dioxygenase